MKNPRQQMSGILMPPALFLIAFMALPFLFLMLIAEGNHELQLLLGIIVVCILLCAAFVAAWRFRIDSAGVMVQTGRTRRQLLWSDVRSIHVRRLVNGWRVILVSSLDCPPSAPLPREIAAQAQKHTIAMSYSRARLSCLREHWKGPIDGIHSQSDG